MVNALRLFPLRTVLFPGMPLSIQIFEPRYHQLLAECLEADEPFGVALIRTGAEAGDSETTPYEIGTTAQIESASPVGGGRVIVRVTGGRRFRILSQHHDRPFLTADVEYPVDEAVEASPALFEAVAEAFEAELRARGVVAHFRRSRGPDIDAACGQLRRRSGAEERGRATEGA